MTTTSSAARRFANAGLIIACVEFVLQMFAHLYPAPILKLYLNGAVSEAAAKAQPAYCIPYALFLILYIILYRLVCRDLDGEPKHAPLLLVISLIFLGGGWSLLMIPLNLLSNILTAHLQGSEALAARGAVESASSLISAVTFISRPLLIAAVTLNWARTKQNA